MSAVDKQINYTGLWEKPVDQNFGQVLWSSFWSHWEIFYLLVWFKNWRFFIYKVLISVSIVVIFSVPGFSFRRATCTWMWHIFARLVSSMKQKTLTPPEHLVLFSWTFSRVSVQIFLLFQFCPLLNRFLSSDYGFVDALVFFVFFLNTRQLFTYTL